MVEQIKIYENNVLALEVINGFTEVDEQMCQKLFAAKREQGFEQINVLIKLDEMKMENTSIKAFFEDAVWALRNYKNMGHIAIVAHSNVLKFMVPFDNVFFQRSSVGREERYFDISQLDKAFAFVEG